MKKSLVFLLTILMTTQINAAQIDNEQLKLRYELENQNISFTQVFNKYGYNDFVMNELARVKDKYDFDKDGLLDYYEVFRNFTDCENPDTDKDGILDGDWSERQENCYSIEVQCSIVKPYHLEFMNDDYQDFELIKENSKTGIFNLILYPEYDQPMINTVNLPTDSINVDEKYLLSGYTISYDDEMENDIKSYLSKSTDYLNNINKNGNLIQDLNVMKYCQIIMNQKSKKIDIDDKGLYRLLPYDKNGNPDMKKINKDKKLKSIFKDDENFNDHFPNLTLEEKYDLFYNTKNAYKNNVVSNCTSISSMEAAIGRVLNVPSRIAVTVPLFSQSEKFDPKKVISNERLLKAFYDSEGKLTGDNSDHLFPEYYIGNQWINFEKTQTEASIKIMVVSDLTELNNYEQWSNTDHNKGLINLISIKENLPK